MRNDIMSGRSSLHNNKNLPFVNKKKPSERYFAETSQISQKKTFELNNIPFNDINAYKLFIAQWFVVVKTYCNQSRRLSLQEKIKY